MKTSLKVQNPDSIEMTLTVTMTLGDWKTLQRQLATPWPAWKLGEAINNMVHKANANFTPDEKGTE